ncbi:MAG: hypothetical protein RIS94_2743 [Pseudomonadota bacterium]|jgi:Ca2+-binding RTX toxin-like protein
MTVASTSAVAGDTWSNVFSPEALSNFAFGQTAPVQLSGDGLIATFTFGSNTIDFSSDVGFTLNPPGGIINEVQTEDTSLTAMSYPLADFMAAVRDGDIDAINAGLWKGNDTINGGASNDTIKGFAGSDKLYGNAGDDFLSGDAGNDRLYGGAGNDYLLGGTGIDQLYGQAGGDRLMGGAGNDLIVGGAGRDELTGGTGADTFSWTAYADFAPINAANPFAEDLIRDFNHAEVDLINLHALDANATIIGNQDFTFIGTAAFGTNAPGQVRVEEVNNSPYLWKVELNTDNDSAAEYGFMTIAFGGQPVAADFVL